MLFAGQPEILRAAQRDDTYKKYLGQSISEVLQSLFGIHFWIRHKELAERLSDVLYQCVTTLSNIQTLGEEYTGIVQVDHIGKSLPKKHYQLLMILLNNFGEKVLNKTLQKAINIMHHLPEDFFLNSKKVAFISIMLVNLRIWLPFLSNFHKALFYFNGRYYELSKRLCGIKYALVRFWLKDQSSLSAFKLLGIVTLIQSVLGMVLAPRNSLTNTDTEVQELKKGEGTDTHDKCPLCLNIRQNTSVTPCGHLFCWQCIIHCLQEQPKCPLCRQVFQPSRVVFLQN